jgi:dihydropteroate synthase
MPATLDLGPLRLDWRRPYVVGIVNATPDSFSDGGRHLAAADAIAHGRALAAAGADLIDVGGESTRPGAAPVGVAEELDRVVPVIEALAGEGHVVSIDTTKAEVARDALAAGARVVNDVSGARFEPAIAAVAAAAGAAFVCGHVRGDDLAAVHAAEARPTTVDEVAAELGRTIAGLPAGLRGRTIADPGLGFGKGAALNLALCARAGDLAHRVSCAVMVGPSRKRFVGQVAGPAATIDARDRVTVGVALAAIEAGAHLVRVHDVAGMVAALRGWAAVRAAR